MDWNHETDSCNPVGTMLKLEKLVRLGDDMFVRVDQYA